MFRRVLTVQSINSLIDLLEQMTRWVDEVPPHPQSNQRFGNLAFREYIKLVEKVCIGNQQVETS